MRQYGAPPVPVGALPFTGSLSEIGGGAVTELRESQMESVNPTAQRRPGVAGSGIGAELRATLALAAPLAAANLAQMAMGVTDAVMVGRLGATPLAAAGLGAMLYFTGSVLHQGFLSHVAPLVAHALGTGGRNAAGRIAGARLALAMG